MSSRNKDIEYVAAAMAAADEGMDCWELLTPDERAYYLNMADAAVRAMEIANLYKALDA